MREKAGWQRWFKYNKRNTYQLGGKKKECCNNLDKLIQNWLMSYRAIKL